MPIHQNKQPSVKTFGDCLHHRVKIRKIDEFLIFLSILVSIAGNKKYFAEKWGGVMNLSPTDAQYHQPL